MQVVTVLVDCAPKLDETEPVLETDEVLVGESGLLIVTWKTIVTLLPACSVPTFTVTSTAVTLFVLPLPRRGRALCCGSKALPRSIGAAEAGAGAVVDGAIDSTAAMLIGRRRSPVVSDPNISESRSRAAFVSARPKRCPISCITAVSRSTRLAEALEPVAMRRVAERERT